MARRPTALAQSQLPTSIRLSLYTAEGESRPVASADQLSSRSRLTEVFDAWFRPVVLARATPATRLLYQDTLHWWCQLAGDPPLHQIDDVLLARFAEALESATFLRGRFGKPRLLSPSTQAKHLRNLRSLLRRCGPALKPGQPTKRLLSEVPYVVIPQPQFERKLPFSLTEAQAIAQASGQLADKHWSGLQCQAFVACLFYTGLRVGTILQLEWSFLIERSGQLMLQVPGRAVSKTGKGISRPVHPQLAHWLRQIPRTEVRILPRSADPKGLYTLHRRLQLQANVSQETLRGLHAWRRTHATEMARLGCQAAMQIAQLSLDHSSSRTTADHYVALEAELVLRLPDLWEKSATDPRQQMLF